MIFRIPRKKPHIYYRKGWWICRDYEYHGRARKPRTAYNAYARYKKEMAGGWQPY